MQIIDGRKIKENILINIKKEVEELPFTPIFCDILVGDDPVSSSYVQIKGKTAESINIKFKKINFPESITTEELVKEIENLNRVPHMCGIIVQLPLPSSINSNIVLDTISPSLDVDCLGFYNSSHFYGGIGNISYPTALACMNILDSLNIDFKNKKIFVLGQGKLVGLPVSHLLRKRGYNISVADSKTENIEFLIKEADVIISAIGKAGFIKGDMIKEGVIIIDAGTSEDNGAVVGDVDIDSVSKFASYVSPTPGGVGPVTVAMLLNNVLQVAKNKK